LNELEVQIGRELLFECLQLIFEAKLEGDAFEKQTKKLNEKAKVSKKN
jgi:hypothetical protein